MRMKNSASNSLIRSQRVRRALLVFGALLLFVAGLLLLFAPARAQDQSGTGAHHFLDGGSGWIMGSQSHEPVSLAGG